MENWETMLDAVSLPASGQTVYIWGAGNTAVLAHQGMLRERLYERLRVSAFLDRNLAGTECNGFPVLSPEVLDALPREQVFVLICTANQWMLREIEEELAQKGIAHCLLDAAVFKLETQRVRQAAALLDERSRQIYGQMLLQRLTLDPPEPELYAGEAYFGIPEFCRGSGTDVVLDCGAYVGDSAERYVWRMEQFRRILAIEPDPGNYRALTKRFARLREEWNFPEDKLSAVCAGVDERTSKKRVDSRVGGLGSIAAEETGDTVFWAIDDLVQELLNGEAPTFLKADIESYEYRMLLGARRTIAAHRPRLAICIYHSAVDFYSIPLLVHELNPAYRLAVRHHSYGQAETVLYAC